MTSVDQPTTLTEEELGRSRSREPDRLAVLLIHGIGDQQPMNTLRDFLKGLFPNAMGPDAHVFSKPDRVSSVMETRRMSGARTLMGVSTDFYELYWAHLMGGTTLGHIGDWIAVLLWRRWREVPRRLKPYWVMTWVVVLAIVAWALVRLARGDGLQLAAGAGILAAVFWVVRFVARRLLLSHVGDAARYLRPAPENIGVRQAIRTAGLDILQKLHDDPLRRYDSIVIVGHSLGSVIAYDILTNFWQRVHWIHNKPAVRHQPKYDCMKTRLATRSGSAGDLAGFRTLQSELHQEEKRLGMPWKVTDLITLGSPLTYADFLMADAAYPWVERRRSREMPTCPPQLEDARDIGFLAPEYKLPDGTVVQNKSLLHHAALFACTRWTNLYFTSDLIGGPLVHLFGDGVQDVRLQGSGPLSHVRYWSQQESEACAALNEAMRACITGTQAQKGSQTMRRVVTGLDDKSHAVVLFDSMMPLKAVAPRIMATNFWITDSYPPNLVTDDPSGRPIGTAPPDNGTKFRVVEFAPLDAAAEAKLPPEMIAKGITNAPARGIPVKHPLMHRTRSLDYAVILSGEIDMMLDDSSVHLTAGDVVVQQATNHAWVNHGKEPCRILFVLMDSKEP